MRGVLHHVVNKHEWYSWDGVGPAACQHQPLSAEKVEETQWLVPGSSAHVRLRVLIMDTRFLNEMKRYTNFRY